MCFMRTEQPEECQVPANITADKAFFSGFVVFTAFTHLVGVHAINFLDTMITACPAGDAHPLAGLGSENVITLLGLRLVCPITGTSLCPIKKRQHRDPFR